MDYCDICYDRPQPLVIHFIRVEARRKTWYSGDRALYTVTVHNRSTLPMDRVVLLGGSAAFLDGSVRVNGLSAPEADPGQGLVVPGLDAGGQVLLCWEELIEDGKLEEHPVSVKYEYRFGGETLYGETRA